MADSDSITEDERHRCSTFSADDTEVSGRKDKQNQENEGCDTYDESIPDYPPGPSDSSGWEYLLSIMPEIEPAFCRISDDGKMVNRMDRLKALGNAVAWQAGAIALRLCIERSGVLDGAAAS